MLPTIGHCSNEQNPYHILDKHDLCTKKITNTFKIITGFQLGTDTYRILQIETCLWGQKKEVKGR